MTILIHTEEEIIMHHFLKVSLATTFAILSVNSQAFSHENAGKMQVQISNQTSDSCQLTKTDVRHGKLLSAAPMAIPQGDAKGFEAEQGSVRGPSVVLTYNCGSNTIVFKSQQTIVKATGSTPEATVLSTNNINLKFDAIASSYLHNKAGILNITLTAK
jgi:hypothetical protein